MPLPGKGFMLAYHSIVSVMPASGPLSRGAMTRQKPLRGRDMPATPRELKALPILRVTPRDSKLAAISGPASVHAAASFNAAATRGAGLKMMAGAWKTSLAT